MSTKRYEALTMSFDPSSKNLRVTSTSTAAVGWAKDLIEEYEPLVRILEGDYQSEFGKFQVERGQEIAWNLFVKLCHPGWEPLSWGSETRTAGLLWPITSSVYSLRYCVEPGEDE